MKRWLTGFDEVDMWVYCEEKERKNCRTERTVGTVRTYLFDDSER